MEPDIPLRAGAYRLEIISAVLTDKNEQGLPTSNELGQAGAYNLQSISAWEEGLVHETSDKCSC